MATNRENLLQQLDVKLTMLSERYDKANAENLRNQQLVEALREENALLKKQYETLKTAKTIAMGEKDVHQAKVQMSRLIHQIDACISLLMVEK